MPLLFYHHVIILTPCRRGLTPASSGTSVQTAGAWPGSRWGIERRNIICEYYLCEGWSEHLPRPRQARGGRGVATRHPILLQRDRPLPRGGQRGQLQVRHVIQLQSNLTSYCRWVDISTWTPPSQNWLYLRHSS